MIFVVSPAKTLDYSATEVSSHSLPAMLKESQQLIRILKKYKAEDIKSLMGVSDNIANLNVGRFKAFERPFTPDNAKQAVLAFKGDVYTGMQADTFDEGDLGYAQQHLRILSGLYGLLRPLDLMQAYRLEMGTKLENKSGKNLYEFWGEKITKEINAALKAQGDDLLVNLASNEYFKAVNKKTLKGKILNISFKEEKEGKFKIIAFFAKKARGMMCHYAIKNKIDKAEYLKGFDYDSYVFNPDLSSENDWVFTR